MEKRLLFFTLLLSVWGIDAMESSLVTNTDHDPIVSLGTRDSAAAVPTVSIVVSVDSETPVLVSNALDTESAAEMAEESKEFGEVKENHLRLTQAFNERLWTTGRALITSSALSSYQVSDINDLEALLAHGKTHRILNSEICNKLLLEALELIPWVVFGNESETYFEMYSRMGAQVFEFTINPTNPLDSYMGLINLFIKYGANPGAVRRDNNSILQALYMADVRRDCLKRGDSGLNNQEWGRGVILIPNPAVTPILDMLCNVDFSIDHRNAHGLTLEDMIRKNTYTSPTDMSYVMGQHLSRIIAKKKLQKKERCAEKQSSCAIS